MTDGIHWTRKMGAFLALSPGLALVVAPALAADDDRDDFEMVPYVGVAIDSFAAGSVNDYLNQESSGQVEERATAGFEFAYRLLSKEEVDRQFWIYGRTTHGARSADVDCRANPDIPICKPFSLELTNPAERGLYLLRNASSLTTGRYEHSFFEVGYGRNDLFLENRSSRLKLNARVVRKWGAAEIATVFAHIAVDVDGGNGSDSIQTYLGFAFPLSGKAD